MTDRDVCCNCPLPDCRESDPGCLLNPKHNPKKGEEKNYPPGPWGIEDTAARLGCKSTDWLRKEIRKFKQGLPASVPRFFMIGNRYRWEPEDVESWMESNKQGGSI
jgi:hypothetical protein